MNLSSDHPGTIYLVGAGPGHPELITRLGYELLQHCDAVAYDALIPLELIIGLPERIERYYVGKRVGKHSRPQEEINELLVSLSRRGLNVVRLKGGDPSIFGRTGEEASHLIQAGIPVVVVPGVTAASAASASSGLSLTDRRAASWVLLGTGHGAECSSIPVPWDQIAALPGGTIALYMGLGKLDQITAQLLSSGLSGDTPSAAVQCASTGLQKVVDAPLSQLSSTCRQKEIKPPAIIFIGQVVRHRLPAPTGAAKPLEGKTVLVTSPSQESVSICSRLRELGAEPIPHPTIKCRTVYDSHGWSQFEKAMSCGGICLFPGEVEVLCFMEALIERDLDLRCLGRFRIAASGNGAETALARRGIKPDIVVSSFEHAGITDLISWKTASTAPCLVWMHGGPPTKTSLSLLSEKFTTVIRLCVCLYTTADWEPHWKDALYESPPDYILFTRELEADGFVQLSGKDLLDRLSARSTVAAMSECVAAPARRSGLRRAIFPPDPHLEGLLRAVVDHTRQQVAEVAVEAFREG